MTRYSCGRQGHMAEPLSPRCSEPSGRSPRIGRNNEGTEHKEAQNGAQTCDRPAGEPGPWTSPRLQSLMSLSESAERGVSSSRRVPGTGLGTGHAAGNKANRCRPGGAPPAGLTSSSPTQCQITELLYLLTCMPSVFTKAPGELMHDGALQPNAGWMVEVQDDEEAGAREHLHRETWVQATAVTAEPEPQLRAPWWLCLKGKECV